ncbi:MAG TPA: ion channel [Hymenobacter sp.]|jgi:inward rectifier potassium channel
MEPTSSPFESSQAPLDPGFGQKNQSTRRSINPDGTFNVRRRGGHYRHGSYQWLIDMSWPKFMSVLVLFFLLLNGLFALVYLLIGIEYLKGAEPADLGYNFLNALFFSVQTFTSVGYGVISPVGVPTNLVASAEALAGVLSFALATGLLYGRFSRPVARILFSKRAIISRRPNGTSCLQFRIANQRSNTLINMQARMLAVFSDANHQREYRALKLERDGIYFLPLNWTIVHDITPDSPLYGLTAEDYAGRSLELLILVQGYDDTFAQDVHARNSYCHNEIDWYYRFQPTVSIDEDGFALLDLDDLHRTEPL